MGESTNACATLRFDRRIRLLFRGATITSDAGLLVCRELDDALGLTETADECLQESRGGRNVQHRLVGLLRQSVYSRLAGYEDTNDAERLADDPTMRVVVGDRGIDRPAASTNTMSRFETEVLTQDGNVEGSGRLNAKWVDGAMSRTPHRRVILDMDSSASPVHRPTPVPHVIVHDARAAWDTRVARNSTRQRKEEVMPREDIAVRLRNGDRLLMDGGTGSEIQRRGIAITRGWDTAGSINSWSARALGEAQEVVRQVHEDYLTAGADIIITNSFWTNRTRMGMDGMADRWEEYTYLAGRIAVDARDAVNPNAYVAGGIAPPKADAPQNGPELAAQAAVLAEAGVDVMLVEYVGSVEDCIVAVEAAGSVGLPVFLGVRHVDRYLADPDRLVQALKDPHSYDSSHAPTLSTNLI